MPSLVILTHFAVRLQKSQPLARAHCNRQSSTHTEPDSPAVDAQSSKLPSLSLPVSLVEPQGGRDQGVVLPPHHHGGVDGGAVGPPPPSGRQGEHFPGRLRGGPDLRAHLQVPPEALPLARDGEQVAGLGVHPQGGAGSAVAQVWLQHELLAHGRLARSRLRSGLAGAEDLRLGLAEAPALPPLLPPPVFRLSAFVHFVRAVVVLQQDGVS